MLFNFRSAFSWVELILYSLVAVAEIDKEDVVTSENLEAALGYHWNLAGRVLGEIGILLVISSELVDFFQGVRNSSYGEDGENGSCVGIEIITPDCQFA
jgi:hypothetical protein